MRLTPRQVREGEPPRAAPHPDQHDHEELEERDPRPARLAAATSRLRGATTTRQER